MRYNYVGPQRTKWRPHPLAIIAGCGLALALSLMATFAFGFDSTQGSQVTPRNTFASATAGNATATITAVTGTRARLNAFSASCNVGAASLTVFNGATQIWHQLVGTTSAAFAWPTGLMGSYNTTMTINLSSCGSGNIGSLSVQGDQF